MVNGQDLKRKEWLIMNGNQVVVVVRSGEMK